MIITIITRLLQVNLLFIKEGLVKVNAVLQQLSYSISILSYFMDVNFYINVFINKNEKTP